MTAKERFLKYVRYDTTSNEESETFPSTDAQLSFLKLLKDELLEMGIPAEMDEHGYVMAKIAANTDSKSKIAFISHVDTSPAVSGKVSPKTIVYGGGDIVLESGEIISVKDNPALSLYVGEEIITSDGTSLLGADDKAGVAEIMNAAYKLVTNPDIKHGDVFIAFTPDEEIGRGVDYFDVKKFGADFGFTIDGGKLGEIEYENFNACSAVLKIKGRSIHPGSAKNRMLNAIDLFTEFHNLLPISERPVATENYEGFYMVNDVNGGVDGLTARYIIRDHDREKFEEKKKYFASACEFLNKKYHREIFFYELKDSYYNMSEIIKDNYHLIENAKAAMEKAGIAPEIIPIRGGTDGARLSFMGLPCPNLSTGGFNFHGVAEYIPSFALEKMTEVILNIIELYL